ncbi:MAG: hypothetical protein RSB41_02635 [Bacilli bacterium]
MKRRHLAYLRIKIQSNQFEFIETYTFLKPTVMYLKNQFFIEVKYIDKNKIRFNLRSELIPEYNKEIILNLCGRNKKSFVIDNYRLCFKLTEINILRRIYCERGNNIC